MYNLEIDFDGYDLTENYAHKMHASTGLLAAEGATLDELLDDATVDVIDEDGGFIEDLAIGDLPSKAYNDAIQLITDYYKGIHNYKIITNERKK